MFRRCLWLMGVAMICALGAPGPVQAHEWKAQWIWKADKGINSWMCFRKQVDLAVVPDKAVARIAVDSKYWLWINGELVVFEGGLNRGPTPDSGYYDTVDLAPHLKTGENVLAILAWYWGNQGRNNVKSGAGGLVFEADLKDSLLLSDKSWKMKQHPAYGYTKGDRTSYLYGGHNIGFDARKDISGWIEPGFDDADWGEALEKGVPPCAPWNKLEERPIPMWKNAGLRPYQNDGALPKTGGQSAIVARLPYAAMITPYLEIDAPAGLTIDIRTDRHRVHGGPGDKRSYNGHHTEYITREGKQAFESLDWLYGENVIYTIPAGVKILALKYRETGYDCAFRGSFECNDPFLNTLWQKCRRTLYICMRDNYMDCPDRERGQWIGDVSSQVSQTFYSLGRSSDKLTTKCVSDFVRWKHGAVLRGNVPGRHALELPSQSLHAISDHGILIPYYQNTGDLSPIREAYPSIIDYLKLWRTQANGMVNPRHGNWHWFDHLGHQDKTVMENVWYYAALKAASEMGALIKDEAGHEWLESRITAIEANFDKTFWKPDGYRSNLTDERANALAVVFGLAGKDKYPVIRKILTTQENCTPYMEAYVLEALFMMGYADDAFVRMKKRYEGMVNASTTTLWEDFSKWGTLNHAWSGAPLTLMCKYGAGIAPIEPGWKAFSVLPHPGPLTKIKVTVPSVAGDIPLAINKGNDSFRLTLQSPKGTKAVVGIPKRLFPVKNVVVNKVLVWNGAFINGAKGITWVGDEDGFLKFSLEPGTWHFHAHK